MRKNFAKVHNIIKCLVYDLIYFQQFSVGPPVVNQSYQLRNFPRLMRNNFTKDHNMIKCIVDDSISYKHSFIFSTYFIWEVPRSLLLNSLFLFKIFIFTQKLLVRNLGTPTVKVFQLCRFQYLLYIKGAMPTHYRASTFVNKSY